MNRGLDDRMALTGQPKYDDTCKGGRWISLNICKIQIQSDQRAAFSLTYVDYAIVRLASERLLDDRVSIVSGCAEYLRE